jgi:solute:Na+ symporter, SSS family
LSHASGLDLAVLGAYLASVLAIGVRFARRSRRPEAFMAAGGRLPGWLVGLSIFGTFVSSISFVALPGKAYAADWNPFVFSLTLPAAAWIATRWFVPFYRATGDLSAYAHLERRFGPWARAYAVACYLLTQLGRTGVILYLVALTLAPLTGASVTALVVATSGVVVVYALLGGIEAVIWTDALQSLVLAGGALLCVAVLVGGIPGGPGAALAAAADGGKLGLGSFGGDLAAPTFWVVLAYGLTINLQNFGIDQGYVQRYAAARSEGEARRSVWLGALLYVPVSATLLLLGTLLFAYYAARPGALPPGTAADAVFPRFVATALPPGLGGLVIAGVLAAAQSTVSTSVNSSATLFLCDVYRRHLRPGAGERESMLVLRGGTLAFGAAGATLALRLVGEGEALDAWWELAGVTSGGMLGLFLLGLLSRRATGAAAGVGVLAGVLVMAWTTLSARLGPDWAWPRSPFHAFLTTVVGTLTVFLVGRAVAAWRRR